MHTGTATLSEADFDVLPEFSSQPAVKQAPLAYPTTEYERSVYQGAQGARSFGGIFALAATAAIIGSFALASMVEQHHKVEKRLSIIDLKLETPPPPAPPPPKNAKPTPDNAKPVSVIDVSQPVVAAPQAVAAPPAPVQPIVAPTAPPAPPPAPPTVASANLAEKLISVRKPVYPVEAKRQHIQGTVELLVIVGTNGKVQEISVRKSSGSPELDQAALDAVRYWRWSPPLANGQPALARGYIPITFNLG